MFIKGLIKCGLNELNLDLTLRSGQSFRWRRRARDESWFGIIDNRYVIELTQNKNQISYKVLNPEIDDKCDHKSDSDFFRQLICDYFRLEVNLCQLYENWSKNDENFSNKCKNYLGIRILRQNSSETFFSFICSANNNIKRIAKMIEKLCEKFGHKLCADAEFGSIYSFPDARTLAEEGVASILRNQLGFGYRSEYVTKSAKMIMNSSDNCPEIWFKNLEIMCFTSARQQLIQMPGIGPKVADCIALMALNHLQAVPIDTHVWRIAREQYLPHLKKNKSLTDKTYKEIADFLRTRFGPMAGWAHSVLFCTQIIKQ